MSTPSPSSTNNGSFVNDSSPPTSLAVTIFIVAFAVIFAIFGGFLVIGLVRRRRNPERYGPRPAIAGRAKQTKKKGLAMAVLESIPVVRFGANNKSSGEGVPKDVELSGALRVEEPARTSNDSRDVAADGEPEIGQLPPADEEPATQDVDGRGAECSICLADFVESEEVRVLPCHHRFHPVCIDPWLLNVSGTCPICRYDLQPSQTRASVSASAQEPDAATADATPATRATPETTSTLELPVSRAPRDRTSFRARLREIRQSAHTGPEYISALRHLHHDHERRRPISTVQVADRAPQEQRST